MADDLGVSTTSGRLSDASNPVIAGLVPATHHPDPTGRTMDGRDLRPAMICCWGIHLAEQSSERSSPPVEVHGPATVFRCSLKIQADGFPARAGQLVSALAAKSAQESANRRLANDRRFLVERSGGESGGAASGASSSERQPPPPGSNHHPSCPSPNAEMACATSPAEPLRDETDSRTPRIFQAAWAVAIGATSKVRVSSDART